MNKTYKKKKGRVGFIGGDGREFSKRNATQVHNIGGGFFKELRDRYGEESSRAGAEHRGG